MSKRKGISIRQREIITGLLFIAPWLVGVVWFFFRNLANTVSFSFSKIEILEEGGYSTTNIAWANYNNALFENVNFNRELVNTLVNMAYGVPMIIFFSLFMALLLNRKFKLRGFVRAVFFLPVVMASASISSALENAMLMMISGFSSLPPEMAERMSGGINPMAIAQLLMSFGMPPQLVQYVITAVAQIYSVIRSSGVQIIIFLAALQAIPSSMYEVSQIEGATAYEAFWKITFPMVSPLILTNVVYTIVDTYSRSRIVQNAYDTAFRSMDFGLSAAMSIMSALLASLFLLVVGFVISRYVYYQT